MLFTGADGLEIGESIMYSQEIPLNTLKASNEGSETAANKFFELSNSSFLTIKYRKNADEMGFYDHVMQFVIGNQAILYDLDEANEICYHSDLN